VGVLAPGVVAIRAEEALDVDLEVRDDGDEDGGVEVPGGVDAVLEGVRVALGGASAGAAAATRTAGGTGVRGVFRRVGGHHLLLRRRVAGLGGRC
jgi:hypothetical protein